MSKVNNVPDKQEVYLDVAGSDDDERDEEDLTVEDGVVEIFPLPRRETSQAETG